MAAGPLLTPDGDVTIDFWDVVGQATHWEALETVSTSDYSWTDDPGFPLEFTMEDPTPGTWNKIDVGIIGRIDDPTEQAYLKVEIGTTILYFTGQDFGGYGVEGAATKEIWIAFYSDSQPKITLIES
jgi:hypothetical protein